jgi:hypothetical protein
MPAPQKVFDLIATFERNAEHYTAAPYKELMLRQQFINPLFECLGWDMENKQGHAPDYVDVIHEAALKIGGETKAPDYSFGNGKDRKFFVEAKKPAITLKDDPGPAYQLRRYAWNRELPLSILTNFREFAVYDGRIRPRQTDKASVARVRYLTLAELPDQWDDIATIFSKDAVLKGSFDKFADTAKSKRGTAAVGLAFLAEIEGWRLDLAKNLARGNPDLSQRDLNYAVQVTIDRIIFLRMCEDRGIEEYGRLRTLTDGPDIYDGLIELFRHADRRYNSGLFYFKKDSEHPDGQPDTLTPGLTIDDKPLKCDYEFSVLPAETLGQVYEQFLGKVIRLTAGHQAKVEDKPEVKKAGGVYYTPKYIVDYIVKHTVGKLLGEPGASATGVSPQQAAKLRILDPACGSGSFLLGAYQYLFDWHRGWYEAHNPEKHAKAIYRTPGGWRLTTGEKKRILVNNIYGVDIDPQAVEVTKLSLLLKVLEGESKDTLERNLFAHRERALPDLASNIKCGNSLIGPDFYEGQQLTMFDEEERYRINVFDWNAAFPAIMKAGGFDAVIGNPPWGQKEIGDEQGIKEYVWSHYASSKGIYDLFRPFVEKGVGLIRSSGQFGMVLPDIVLLKDYVETRKLLLKQLMIGAIDWWGMAFADAVIDAATIIGVKNQSQNGHLVSVAVHDPEAPLAQMIPQSDFWSNPRHMFNLHLTPEKRGIINHLEKCPRLGDYFEVHEGVHSGNIRDELFVERRIDKTCKPLIFGRDEIQPYFLRWNGKYIRLGAMPEHRTKKRYANAGSPEWYDQEKVLVRRTGDFVLAGVDRERRYASNNFFIVFPKQPCSLDLDGLCALLNSHFMTWFFRTIEPRRGRVFAELKIKHLSVFPLPSVVQEKGGCNTLNQLGSQRAQLSTTIVKGHTPNGVRTDTVIRQTIDCKIDQVVDRLLGIEGQSLDVSPNMKEI